MEDGTAVRRDGFPGTPAKSPARTPFLRGWPPPLPAARRRAAAAAPAAGAGAGRVGCGAADGGGGCARVGCLAVARPNTRGGGSRVGARRALARALHVARARTGAARAAEVRDGDASGDGTARAPRSALRGWCGGGGRTRPRRRRHRGAPEDAAGHRRMARCRLRHARGRTTQRKMVRDRLEFGRLTTPALSVAGRSRRAVAAPRATGGRGRRRGGAGAAAAERWRARVTAVAKLVALSSGDRDLS